MTRLFHDDSFSVAPVRREEEGEDDDRVNAVLRDPLRHPFLADEDKYLEL